MLSLLALTAIATWHEPMPETTLSRLQALRDSFVRRAIATGFKCTLPPPKILIDKVVSFGGYDRAKNTLTIVEWDQLPKDQKAFFGMLAGKGATSDLVRQTFETVIHKYVFVHELGHWTQACRKWRAWNNHYATEQDANRVSTAYWREVDSTVLTVMSQSFARFTEGMPSPVPAGNDEKKFFNDNYGKLVPTPGFIWYQANMVAIAYKESPAPTLKQMLHP